MDLPRVPTPAEVRQLIAAAGFNINQYARCYIDALDVASGLYGKEGIRVQIAYIACNLRASGDAQKAAKAQLLRWAGR